MNYKINIIFSLVAAFILILLFTPFAFAQAPVSYGQTVSDSISVTGEQDEFVFSGTTGDVIILPFTKISGDFNPYVELFDPQGTRIAYSSSGVINATLAATGDFKISVRDYNNTHTGNYQFSSRFSANAGDTLYIPLPKVSGASNSFTPYLELYDSAGTRLAYSSSGTLTATVPCSAGNYYFYLTDSSRTGTGAYEFTLQRTNNPQNFKDLSYNSITEDSLGAVTGINVYRFTANANDKITVCSAIETETSGNFSSYLELYDTAGTRLASGLESLKYTFGDGGTFYLFITAYSHSGTGKYKFILLNGDVSCSNSGLINPRVSLIKPQAGEIIEAGSTYKISWTSSDDVGVVTQEIRLSLNSGTNYPTVIASGLTADVQSYDWPVPANLSTNRARIKVIACDAQGHQGEDAVKGDITIIKTTLPANSVNINYEYDSLSQLIDSAAAFATYSYSYDALGNRLNLTTGDTTAPTTPVVTDSGQFTNKNDRLYASWLSSDSESGIAEYQYCIGTAKGTPNVLGWTSAGTNTSVTKTGLSLTSGKVYYFGVKAKNGAGLWSSIGYSNGITVDTTPPTGSIKINNGAEYTSTINVTLNLSATDTISGMGQGSQMRFSNNGFSWSMPEAYTATKSWKLILVMVKPTVYVKFKDAAGNWSGAYSDSILVKNKPPIAKIIASPTKGKSPLSVKFYGNQSTDSDGKIVSYSWNFGDGATSTLINPSHTFKNTSILTTKYFTVTLTVKDNSGATSSSKTTIRVYPRWKIF